jgi:N-acetylglucosamine-6-phosphate deacetylase
MEKGKIHHALDAVRDAMIGIPSGAKVLGAHLEGPFISPMYKGAHDAVYFQQANFEFVEDYLDVIKIITLAPEADPDFAFIKKLRASSDIVLSVGHTNSDYETVMKAITEGVGSATHLFNAMAPFHHRAPGPVGAVLNSEISFELIADNLHVHPAIYQILVNAKGYRKMILVTDAMRAAGMDPGDWELGGQKVSVDEDSARLVDGTLAGSVIGLNQAVANILKHTDLNLHEAVSLASINPARLLKLDKQMGSIEIGKNADLIIFDENIHVSLTILDGKIIHTSE